MTHGPAAGVKGSRHGYPAAEADLLAAPRRPAAAQDPGSLSDGMADVGIEMGRHTWSLR